MARTKAQEKNPQKTYGQQTHRGNIGEKHAADLLRKEGYSVSISKTHPRGIADIIAVKGNETRKIQVKRISSRNFLTASAARNRLAGKPFNLKRLPTGYELWIFDASNRLYTFRR